MPIFAHVVCILYVLIESLLDNYVKPDSIKCVILLLGWRKLYLLSSRNLYLLGNRNNIEKECVYVYVLVERRDKVVRKQGEKERVREKKRRGEGVQKANGNGN